MVSEERTLIKVTVYTFGGISDMTCSLLGMETVSSLEGSPMTPCPLFSNFSTYEGREKRALVNRPQTSQTFYCCTLPASHDC